MQDKKSLRKSFSALRSSAKSAGKDAMIAERLLSLDVIVQADTILLYASFGSEVDTWNIAEKLLKLGKAVAFPRCGESGAMTFHLVSELDRLREGNAGKYGIFEPDSSLPSPTLTTKSVCIIPGLAFTNDGGRLGYGGGYYDRFLSACDVLTVALAYNEIITEELPLMPHDLRVNMIVTEERTVLCNG